MEFGNLLCWLLHFWAAALCHSQSDFAEVERVMEEEMIATTIVMVI